MTPSAEVSEFIKAWEGCRLETYLDAAGFPTVGFGHCFQPHEPQPERITQWQADVYFCRDLADHALAVDDMVEVDISQHEFDALVSFCFNLGQTALKRSSLLRKVNERRYADAAHEFERWVYAGQPPKKIAGLVKRRAAECAMFESGRYDGRP